MNVPAKTLTIADVTPTAFYTIRDLARLRGVSDATAWRWVKKYKLARTVDGRLLGSTIIRFCGRDAGKLATTTISDKEFQKRSDAAAGRVKAMV